MEAKLFDIYMYNNFTTTVQQYSVKKVKISQKGKLYKNTKALIPGYFEPYQCFRVLFGGDKGARTPDLMAASHALSQLSYIPIN